MVTVNGVRYRVEDAIRLGLISRLEQTLATEPKQGKAPANKARKAPANKK